MLSTRTDWKDVPVLVTGGAGFVGAHLAHALIAEGARVTILDVKPSIPDLKGHYRDVSSGATYVSGSVADERLVDELIRRERFHAIFHLAAEAIVSRFHQDPAQGLESNVKGTWVVLEAVRRHTPEAAVVIASSDKAYGSHPTLPYTETFPLQGRNPYDCSKSCTDLISHMYAHAYGLRMMVTRCGNIYGDGDLNFSRIVPYTIAAAHRNTCPVLRSDGKFLRDYVHVRDIVQAYLRSADALRDGHATGEAYNFGHNAPVSVIHVVETILDLMGAAHLAPVIQDQAKHEIRDQYLDAGKAMQRLGWSPTIGLRDGLQQTIAWYRAFVDGHPTYDYS
jgi:CDP-glucose 4,6-dehydratase